MVHTVSVHKSNKVLERCRVTPAADMSQYVGYELFDTDVSQNWWYFDLTFKTLTSLNTAIKYIREKLS